MRGHMTDEVISCVLQAAAGRDLKTVCKPSCPSSLYEVVKTKIDETSCEYMCVKPVLMSCPEGPARNPIYCGGSTKKVRLCNLGALHGYASALHHSSPASNSAPAKYRASATCMHASILLPACQV